MQLQNSGARAVQKRVVRAEGTQESPGQDSVPAGRKVAALEQLLAEGPQDTAGRSWGSQIQVRHRGSLQERETTALWGWGWAVSCLPLLPVPLCSGSRPGPFVVFPWLFLTWQFPALVPARVTRFSPQLRNAAPWHRRDSEGPELCRSAHTHTLGQAAKAGLGARDLLWNLRAFFVPSTSTESPHCSLCSNKWLESHTYGPSANSSSCSAVCTTLVTV